MRLKAITVWIGIVLAGSGSLVAAGGPPPSATPLPAAQYRTVLNRYCVTCHNVRLRTADLLLDKADLEHVRDAAPLWEKVVTKLRARAMPPPGIKKRPDAATYDAMAGYLESELDAAAAAHPNPGRPTIQRLNRAEYTNAIRDLLALEIDGEKFLPADDASYGFDNIGDILTVSPSLLERYLRAAVKISSLAVGDPNIGPSSETYVVPKRTAQDERADESLPFGSRGGIAIHHYFPLDGEYDFNIRLERDRVLDIIGLAEPHQLDVRLDGAKIKDFIVGGKKNAATSEFGPQDYRHPASKSGEESYERTADAGLQFRFSVKAGPHILGVSFLDKGVAEEGIFRKHNVGAQYAQPDDIPGIGQVSIVGPYDATGPGDTASRRKIFLCRPASSQKEDACARKILATLARRAFRRPVTPVDLQTLLSFYQSGRQQGGFETGIESALRRILVDPEFLFRIERDPEGIAPGTPYQLDDIALASRLSFFLWSSIPDDQLLDLAERRELKDPAILEQQVRRMLADPRAEALITNFAGQWLYVRNMKLVMPNPENFPDFDENLRQAFEKETKLFFESMLHEDRSVVDLLDADYTFLNDRLARHYGIPNIYGSHFRRVQLLAGARRGLIGQGSVLTVTSYATRTSPTLRGKWLLANVLGAPTPPPPANIPSLKDRGEDGKILSVREQMEMHRSHPACMGCHGRMDPLGFALENFDAVGRWRTTSGADNTPIDSSGVLPDGTKFQGPAELRQILLSRREDFVRTVTEKLMTYALGRGMEYYDAPAIRKIVREATPSNYRWSSLILGIARSIPFRMRRSQEP